jgi:hypothetical protein
MKTATAIAASILLLLVGCQKPTEVQLTGDEEQLELDTVNDPDGSFERAAVDSTALLPREQQDYAGFVTLTAIRTDIGNVSRTTVVARVVVEDKRRSVIFNGRRMFIAYRLGFVRVDGALMLPRERSLGGQVSAGVEYVRELSSYEPGRPYTFSADSIGSLALTASDVVTVEAPVTGTAVPRNQDLPLRWNGRGDLKIIVSALRVDSGQFRTTPLLVFRPRRNEGRALIPKRILNGLPRGAYVFTFVVANRDERPLPGRFAGLMLLQASSIHNIVVELR